MAPSPNGDGAAAALARAHGAPDGACVLGNPGQTRVRAHAADARVDVGKGCRAAYRDRGRPGGGRCQAARNQASQLGHVRDLQQQLWSVQQGAAVHRVRHAVPPQQVCPARAALRPPSHGPAAQGHADAGRYVGHFTPAMERGGRCASTTTPPRTMAYTECGEAGASGAPRGRRPSQHGATEHKWRRHAQAVQNHRAAAARDLDLRVTHSGQAYAGRVCLPTWMAGPASTGGQHSRSQGRPTTR